MSTSFLSKPISVIFTFTTLPLKTFHYKNHRTLKTPMAKPQTQNPSSSIDPHSGFCSKTKIFYSLRPPVPLPPEHLSISTAQYAFSLFSTNATSSPETTIGFINATNGTRLTYAEFIHRYETLAQSLQSRFGLRRGETAFILSPSCFQIPIIYFSLLSLGVIVSPSNPISTDSEISRQISLTKPSIAFATSAIAHKLPASFRHGTILIDSPDFYSMMTSSAATANRENFYQAQVKQSDTAAILYSSGTTGRVKGVILTHRNFISLLAGYHTLRFDKVVDPEPHPVSLFTIPLFHVFGFFMCLRAVALGETVVLMERFDFVTMLKAVEIHRITFMPVSPPLVVAMAKLEIVKKYDLSSLMLVGCGGAPLGKEVSEKFIERFPQVYIVQGYGLTESAGGGTRMLAPSETKKYGSAGRLAENTEAKIVDPVTGEGLPPGHRGELWMRAPTIMKGYIGDDEATASTLDPEGWLKTGDLCYIDSDGFIFVVDRLKELIKYKAYQVPPAELEHLLQSHPEIADVAVIPYPDEEAGQIPMAYVVRKPGSTLSESQVMDFVAKQVAPYKKVRRVAFISVVPKSAAGKILRRELIDSALSAPSAKL